MADVEIEVRQISTLALGAVVLIVLFPVVALGLTLGSWAGLIIGVPLVLMARFVQAPPHLRMPRLLMGALGLFAIAFSIMILLLR